jgi:hypothetical protein
MILFAYGVNLERDVLDKLLYVVDISDTYGADI